MAFNHYNKRLNKYARGNKASMTKAEACIWKYVLSKRQMQGYRFRRQRPIDNYIVDFCCLPLQLIVEVDGYSHELEEVGENDKIRQSKLESLGFTVFRFEDSEVLHGINQVRETIWNWIDSYKS